MLDLESPLHNPEFRQTLESLRARISAFVEYDSATRPQHLISRFGLGRDLARRVVTACAAGDALAFAYESPGAASLRTLVATAERGRVDRETAEEASRAVERFAWAINAHFGDQSLMKTMIASETPRLRAQLDLKRKQAAFKGARDIRGVHSETDVLVTVFARSASTGLIQLVFTGAHLGLQRLWPGRYLTRDYCRRVNSETGAYEPNGSEHIVEDWVSRVGVEDIPSRFDYPWIEPSLHRHDEWVDLSIEQPMLGPRQAVNVGYTSIVPNGGGSDGRLRSQFGPIYQPSQPSKLMIWDTLIDPSLVKDGDPELRIYDMTAEGPVGFEDTTREYNRIDLDERVQAIPPGANLECPEFAPLSKLVDFSLSLYDTPPSGLLRYRIRQEYPVYGSQVSLVFRAADPAP